MNTKFEGPKPEAYIVLDGSRAAESLYLQEVLYLQATNTHCKGTPMTFIFEQTILCREIGHMLYTRHRNFNYVP